MSSDGIYYHKLMFCHLKTSCYYRYGLTSHEWGFVINGTFLNHTAIISLTWLSCLLLFAVPQEASK